MHITKKYIMYLIIMITICVAKTADARTITVSKDREAEFRSIQAAVDAANPGDTILVGKGVYYETVTIEKKGTKENPITLRAESSGLGDVIVTAADEKVRTGKQKWTLLEGTDDVYYVEWDKMVGSVTCDNLFLTHILTLEQLKTRQYNGTYIGFPSIGYHWDKEAKRVYIRLHDRYFESLNPNDYTTCIGGECFEWLDEEKTKQGAKGQYQAMIKNTSCYNIAVWSEGEAWVNIEGFTLETPGTCGIYVRGDNVNVRNCWFRGCRVGVFGSSAYKLEGICTKNVVVEHCDFTQYPAMYEEAMYLIELHKDPEIMKKDEGIYYYWGMKNRCVRYDYETVGFIVGAGYNWEICNNYTYDTFEPLSQSWHWTDMENATKNGMTWLRQANGSKHKIHHNRFENQNDNVIEFESHALDVEFYNNECINVPNAISWQPLNFIPLPQNIFIYNNLFYNSDEHFEAIPGSQPLKIGLPKDLFINDTDGLYALYGIWEQPDDIYHANRHWFVDDKGFWIYNNTFYNPGAVIFGNLGALETDDRFNGGNGWYGTGLGIYNNICYGKARFDGNTDSAGNKLALFIQDYSIEQNTNLFVPGNIEEVTDYDMKNRFNRDGYIYNSIDAAGIKIVENNGIKWFEVADANSKAVNGGTQVEWSVEDTPYLGAIPYGEKWEQIYGVYPIGDINADRKVDGNDIMHVAKIIGSKRGEEKFVNRADLNYDNVIDNSDIQLLNDILAGGRN